MKDSAYYSRLGTANATPILHLSFPTTFPVIPNEVRNLTLMFLVLAEVRFFASLRMTHKRLAMTCKQLTMTSK